MTRVYRLTFMMLTPILCILLFPANGSAQNATITGDFPIGDGVAIYAEPFLHADRSDLLIVDIRTVPQGCFGKKKNADLWLYSFDDERFNLFWIRGISLYLEDGLPRGMDSFCFGDFDGDGRYSIITCRIKDIIPHSQLDSLMGGGQMVHCKVKDIRHFMFADSTLDKNNRPVPQIIKTPDVWIDQLIACDINNDGSDEVIALQFSNPDTCSRYELGIYKLMGDSLVEIWKGLDGIGVNPGFVPPDRFISIVRIDGYLGEMPVMMGPQSDMSLTYYKAIALNENGEYDTVYPFPKPHGGKHAPAKPTTRSEEVRERYAKEKENWSKDEGGPIGGIIFNDGERALHYGYFEDYNAPDPHQRLVKDHFAVLEKGYWKSLEKQNSQIGGLMTKFTIEPGRTGWLFLKDGKYYFYDRLPVKE
jgi:hypothetical protein